MEHSKFWEGIENLKKGGRKFSLVRFFFMEPISYFVGMMMLKS